VSEATIRKFWAKQEVIRKHSALISEETEKEKIERLSADLQSWKISYIFTLMVCVKQTCPLHSHSPFWKQYKLLN